MPDPTPEAHEGDYWYNVRTGQVEAGPQSDWKQLLGPYPTREAAANAMATVKEHNDEWEADED